MENLSSWARKLRLGFNQSKCGRGLFVLVSTNIKVYDFARELEATNGVPTSSALPVLRYNYAYSTTIPNEDVSARSFYHRLISRVDSASE